MGTGQVWTFVGAVRATLQAVDGINHLLLSLFIFLSVGSMEAVGVG